MSDSETKAIEKAKKPLPDVPIVGGHLRPTSFEQMWRVANAFHAAGMLPAGVKTVPQTLVALFAGASVGLDPVQSIQNIMVVNNRPAIFGDAMLAVCEATGLLEDIEETIEGEGDDRVAICKITKKGRKTPIVRRFSVADAKTAGLWQKRGRSGEPTPWITFPIRMLTWRARSWACRDAFPGAVKGLRTPDEEEEARVEADAAHASEAQDYIEGEAVEIDAPQTQAEPAVEAVEDPPFDDTPQDAPVMQAPKEWGEPPKRNPATHPGYHRIRLVESARNAINAKPNDFGGLSAEDLVRRLEDAWELPKPGTAEGPATRAYANAVVRVKADDFNWAQFGSLDLTE